MVNTSKIIDLISQNRFDKLIEEIQASENPMDIHLSLVDVLKHEEVKTGLQSYTAVDFHQEIMEACEIYRALADSDLAKEDVLVFLNLLVVTAFEAGTAMQKVNLASMSGEMKKVYEMKIVKLVVDLREKVQEMIEFLKTQDLTKPMANLAMAKGKLTMSIGYLLEKTDIGNDMLQMAQSYLDVGMNDEAIELYKGIIRDFGSESNGGPSASESDHVDTRSQKEVDIYKKAKVMLGKLSE